MVLAISVKQPSLFLKDKPKLLMREGIPDQTVKFSNSEGSGAVD